MKTPTEEAELLTISKEELNELEPETIPIPIRIITGETDDEEIREACRYLSQSAVLGFDTETKPVFQKGQYNPVSLLQLSTSEYAFLFRLSTFENKERLAPLQELLGNEQILKVGVAIQEDCTELYRDHGLVTNSTLDLRHLATADKMEVHSLSKIYALLYGKRLTKGQRLTDWEQPELTPAQVDYAGLDAYAGLKIYNALQHLVKQEMINCQLQTQPKKKKKKLREKGVKKRRKK